MIHQPIVPQGSHQGLDFEHSLLVKTGSFTPGSGMKTVWHTTEGGSYESVIDTLTERKVEPHFLLDPVHHRVFQFISLDQYARALEHPAGTPETNRGGAIQVEILGHAGQAPKWSDEFLKTLASLALVIEHRKGVQRISSKVFRGHPGPLGRVKPENWVGAHGHFGHQHAPDQPGGHWDPGALDIRKVFWLMGFLEH